MEEIFLQKLLQTFAVDYLFGVHLGFKEIVLNRLHR